MFRMNENTVWAILIIVGGAVVITGIIVDGETKTNPHPHKSIPVTSIKAKGVVLGKTAMTLTIQTAADVIDEHIESLNTYNVIEEGDTIK